MLNEITNQLVSNLQTRLENIFIEGLKLKGYEFSKKNELEKFVKIRCRCEDYQHENKRIYYVDQTPFLLHNYELEFTPFKENYISANYGTFKFL